MNLLLELYNKVVLFEALNVNSVTDSIKHRYQVVINYEGDPSHGIAPGKRTIQAYAYGLTKAGNPVIRAYQPYGDTASEVPSWKFFRLDRITNWEPTYYITTKPAPNFNPNGDKTMSTVYTIADFTLPVDIERSKTLDIDTIKNRIKDKEELLQTKGKEMSSKERNFNQAWLNYYKDKQKAATNKQAFKPIGKIDNIDDILAAREKEKQVKNQQTQIINSPKPSEPIVKGVENIEKQEIKEPEVQGVEPQENEELKKIKDLNNRMDNLNKK